jgi:hypothetical protein
VSLIKNSPIAEHAMKAAAKGTGTYQKPIKGIIFLWRLAK